MTGTALLAQRRAQRGLTLLELLVGMAVGLLVVAVAAGALMVSRGVSGTVSDAADIQQQGAYALRVIGQQLRQSGALNLDLGVASGVVDRASHLAAATSLALLSEPGDPSNVKQAIDGGSDTQFTVRFANFIEPTFASDGPLTRSCLGTAPAASKPYIQNVFSLSGSELRCSDGGTAQAVVRQVANFRLRYLRQTDAQGTMQYVKAADIAAGDWASVFGVEVCLVLYGSEAIDMPAGTGYTDCDGSSVDMTTLSGERARRMHIVFRNLFQLRSQGAGQGS